MRLASLIVWVGLVSLVSLVGLVRIVGLLGRVSLVRHVGPLPIMSAYMQKTSDVAEKAILAKKKLRKKCVNRDKM